MHRGTLTWTRAPRLALFAALALGLVIAVSLAPGGWGRAYGDTTPGGGGGNHQHQGEEGQSEVSTQPDEQAVGGEPNAADTQHQDLESGQGFHADDGMLDAVETGGQPVAIVYDPIPPDQLHAMNSGLFPGPTPPPGELRVGAFNLEITPVGGTPNQVTLTLHYTDEQLAAVGVNEGTLMLALFLPAPAAPGGGTWVQLTATQDMANNTFTITTVDVSAFANHLHQVALLGHA